MARSYRSYRSFGYGNECRTKLTEVLCTGMDVVQNSQKFRVQVIPAGKYTPSGEEFDLKWRISSNLHKACSHWVNVPEAIGSCVAIIVDKHHRGDKSWTSTSGDRGNSRAHGYIQIIAQRTPAVAPQKKSWRSQAQICHQLDRPSATTSKRSDRKQRLQ